MFFGESFRSVFSAEFHECIVTTFMLSKSSSDIVDISSDGRPTISLSGVLFEISERYGSVLRYWLCWCDFFSFWRYWCGRASRKKKSACHSKDEWFFHSSIRLVNEENIKVNSGKDVQKMKSSLIIIKVERKSKKEHFAPFLCYAALSDSGQSRDQKYDCRKEETFLSTQAMMFPSCHFSLSIASTLLLHSSCDGKSIFSTTDIGSWPAVTLRVSFLPRFDIYLF